MVVETDFYRKKCGKVSLGHTLNVNVCVKTLKYEGKIGELADAVDK